MVEKKRERPVEKHDTEIVVQSHDEPVAIGGDIQIIGNLGSQVVISGSSVQARNIAGGPHNGNVYLVASADRSPAWIRKTIEEQPLDSEQRAELSATVNDIFEEAGRGEDADMHLVRYLLSIVEEYSPAVYRGVRDWLASQRPGDKLAF